MSKELTLALLGGAAALFAGRLVQDVTNQKTGAAGAAAGIAGAALALFLTMQVVR